MSFIRIVFVLTTLILLSGPVHGQIFLDPDTGEEHEIYQDTPPEILSKFLVANKATDILFNDENNFLYFNFPFQLKNKKGLWVLCGDDGQPLHKKGYAQIDFPRDEYWDGQVTIAKDKKGWYGFLFIGFDKVRPYFRYDYLEFLDMVDDEFPRIYIHYHGLWGLVTLFQPNKVVDIEPATYKTREEVPLVDYNFEFIEELSAIKRQYNLNQVIFMDDGEYELVKGRHKKTGKWGLYHLSYKHSYIVIPAKYDSIRQHEPWDEFYYVWNNGKAGLYFDGKMTIQAEYDEVTVYTDGFGFARKDESWWLYDIVKGKRLSDQSHTDPEQLLDDYLNPSD